MSKSILITGISSGIGHVVIKRCLKENFNVTGVLREESQKKLFSSNGNLPPKLHIADLSNRQDVQSLSKQIQGQSFDYVLLNAGCGQTGMFHELSDSSINHIIDTNLVSNMHLVHTLLPNALEHGTKFIFVSSLAARLPAYRFASYATSKAAISKFCNSLRREYPKLSFLCVEIGAVDTPLHEKSGNIVENKKNFKSAESIGNKLFEAMVSKTGTVTLSPDWWITRKVAMVADELLTKFMVGHNHG